MQEPFATGNKTSHTPNNFFRGVNDPGETCHQLHSTNIKGYITLFTYSWFSVLELSLERKLRAQYFHHPHMSVCVSVAVTMADPRNTRDDYPRLIWV